MMRLYKFQSHPEYNFYACRSQDNHQYLLGFDDRDFLVITFSPEGVLQGVAKEGEADQPYFDLCEAIATEWISQHQLRVGTIEVEKFSVPSYGIQIRDLPDYLEDYINNKRNYTDVEQKDYEDEIEIWRSNQSYVFDWSVSDFWINRDGEITAT
jgi:hypothetical protein